MCDRWRYSYESFRKDMGIKPVGLSLDRMEVNGNYEPSNCKWATNEEQMRNRRNTYILNGSGRTIKEISKYFFCSGSTVLKYLKKNDRNAEAAWSELAVFRNLGMERQREANQGTTEPVCEMGPISSEGGSSQKGPQTLQELRSNTGSKRDEGTSKTVRYTPTGMISRESFRTIKNREKAVRLKLKGFTYTQIATTLSLSKARILALVHPPKNEADEVFARSRRLCEVCESTTPRGQLHHITTEGKTIETFNLADNLQYTCARCHMKHHIEVLREADPNYFRKIGRAGGSSRSECKIRQSQLNADKAAKTSREKRPKPTRACPASSATAIVS